MFASVVMALSTASADSTATHAVGPPQTASIPSARTESAAQAPTSTTVASSAAEPQNSNGPQSKQPAGSCQVIDRPKHTITYCECSPRPALQRGVYRPSRDPAAVDRAIAPTELRDWPANERGAKYLE